MKSAAGPERHAHIVIGLRLFGIEREGFGIAPDGVVEAAGAMRVERLFESLLRPAGANG